MIEKKKVARLYFDREKDEENERGDEEDEVEGRVSGRWAILRSSTGLKEILLREFHIQLMRHR